MELFHVFSLVLGVRCVFGVRSDVDCFYSENESRSVVPEGN